MRGDEQGYNGYANYETRCAALWIDNDPSSYKNSRAMARDVLQWTRARWDWESDEDAQFSALAESLQEWVKFNAPDLGASMYADLLNHALGAVDWREIAENYVSEVKEEATA